MGKLGDIAEKISDLERGGVYNLDGETEDFICLTGEAFSQVYKLLKALNQKSELGNIAKELQELRYTRKTNIPAGIMRPFFGLTGKAFAELEKSLEALKKANENAITKVASDNVNQETIKQITDNQKQR